MTKKQRAVIKKWVEVLRSGKYRQGREALVARKPGKHVSYCCLGVLCNLAVEEGIIEKHWRGGYGSNNDIHYLPQKVQNWAGLQTIAGGFGKHPITDSLANLNDEGSSFKEIADVIESKPKGLFV
jgi:hypothetical protein